MEADIEQQPMLTRLKRRAGRYHERIPWIRRLPGPAVGIIALLIVVQILVWITVGIILHFHTALVSTAVLSYTLGLRHALDADHISAIDLMTRRLVAAGQQPVTVGTFFSLGHSTIVIVTSIVVAASSTAIQDHFGAFSGIGSIIGSSISAAFLLLLGAMNIWILSHLHRQLLLAIAAPTYHEPLSFPFESSSSSAGGGCMTLLLRHTSRLIDTPWKMYPLGVLFGLSFDTSSEIALLGISALQAAHGTSIWLILLFPVLFTSGMCLLDTLDGAAMSSLYASARLARDPIAVLYYQLVLTGVTVAVALAIGVIQLLTMVHNVRPDFGGPFWRGVDAAADHYDIIGGSICASFVVCGLLSVVLYGPWRRSVDRRRRARAVVEGGDDERGASQLGEVEVLELSVPAAHDRDWRREAAKCENVDTRVTLVGESSGSHVASL